MPLPATVAVPTVVPPLHLVGAVARGPITVKVIVPVASVVPPDSVELIELGSIAVLVVPLAGAATVVLVAFWTIVEAIPAPHVLLEALLLASPL